MVLKMHTSSPSLTNKPHTSPPPAINFQSIADLWSQSTLKTAETLQTFYTCYVCPNLEQIQNYVLAQLNVFGLTEPHLTLQERITRAAAQALKMVAALSISLVLCYYHPHFFVLGFTSGVFFDDILGERIQRIERVWSQNNLGVKLGISCFSALTLPLTLSLLSLWVGAKWAHYLTLDPH